SRNLNVRHLPMFRRTALVLLDCCLSVGGRHSAAIICQDILQGADTSSRSGAISGVLAKDLSPSLSDVGHQIWLKARNWGADLGQSEQPPAHALDAGSVDADICDWRTWLRPCGKGRSRLDPGRGRRQEDARADERCAMAKRWHGVDPSAASVSV